MDTKLRVAIICGGKSAEHEISIMSAKNVADALDKSKYEVSIIEMDKQGKWQGSFCEGMDVVFPLVHGTHGEDGCLQGWLKLAQIPFVGAGVLGSAASMDKDVTKRLLRDAGLPVARFLTYTAENQVDSRVVMEKLGFPVFIKPANLGSSIGISLVDREEDFLAAVRLAFTYDTKILIEEYVVGREIECAVLGNEDPVASIPGEIIPRHSFYSYEAKYIDPEGASLHIPAVLSEESIFKIQQMAISAYKAMCCSGMARVDFFLKNTGELVINELNTLPGFTPVSMYPKMWEASGLSYAQLLDRLITLACERFQKESCLKTSYQ